MIENAIVKMDKVTRVEVIDEDGRSYVKYLDEAQETCCSIQDNGKTLKIFIQPRSE